MSENNFTDSELGLKEYVRKTYKSRPINLKTENDFDKCENYEQILEVIESLDNQRR